MKLYQFFLTFALLWAANSTQAATPDHVYEIQLATYAAPDYQQFESLFNTGYVYTKATSSGLYKVMMGTYSSKSLAQKKLAAVQRKGFKDAFLVKRSLDESEAVYIVQLATYDQQADIYWPDWQRLSTQLVAQLSDDKVRVAVGPFYTRAEAEATQYRLQSIGPKDIFIKKVSEQVLHEVGLFDWQRVPSYGQSTGTVRNSVKALQLLLAEENLYDVPSNGLLTPKTKAAITAFKQQNDHYKRHMMMAKSNTAPYKIEAYTLQYYINRIPEEPVKAAEGLKQFKNPIAKMFLAYMYFNEDVRITNKNQAVNRLMNEALAEVFKGYRGETRYDYSMRYAYEDLEQLLQHLKAVHEVLKVRPDMPCWLLQRHPRAVEAAFRPHWNNSRDDYNVSNDCGSFFDQESLRVLLMVSEEFAANDDQEQTLMDINRWYVLPRPIPHQEIEQLEQWNGRLWTGLAKLKNGNPLEQNMYTLLRFSYYDALQELETRFIEKGLPGVEARSLGLKVLKEAIGPNLAAYL
jgi:hypothetical protein